MDKLWFEKGILKGRNEKLILIAKIKGLAEMSVNLRRSYIKNIKRNKEKIQIEKYNFYSYRYSARKKYVGEEARYHLLALGLLSGKKYTTIERKCGKLNKPSAKKLLEIINQNISFLYSRNKITEEMVSQWLNESLEDSK